MHAVTRLGMILTLVVPTIIANAYDCPDVPVPPPVCPCSGSIVADNMVLNGGVWCFNGGDDTLSNIILQSGAVLIICSDVTLYNISINNPGTLVIAPGASVTVSGNGTWSVNGTIVNYGNLLITIPTNIASGGAFFNGGYVQATEPLTINSLSGYVGLPGSNLEGSQIEVTVLAQCGICLYDATVHLGCINNGGATPSLCVDSASSYIPCLQIDSCANVTSDLTTDTIYLCGSGATQIDTQYLGGAVVDPDCICNGLLSYQPVLRLSVDKSGDRLYLLRWKWEIPPQAPVIVFRIWLFDGHRLIERGKTSLYSYTDEASCEGTCFYRVEAILSTMKSVLSNSVRISANNQFVIIILNGTTIPEVVCQSQRCNGQLLNIDGRILHRFTLKYKETLRQATTGLPDGVYILKVNAGLMHEPTTEKFTNLKNPF